MVQLNETLEAEMYFLMQIRVEPLERGNLSPLRASLRSGGDFRCIRVSGLHHLRPRRRHARRVRGASGRTARKGCPCALELQQGGEGVKSIQRPSDLRLASHTNLILKEAARIWTGEGDAHEARARNERQQREQESCRGELHIR